MAVALVKLPVETSALTPTAVLSEPVVLLRSAPNPLAVLLLPAVLLKSALSPLAVLLLPVVLLKTALYPIAVLLRPMTTLGNERLGVLPPEETKGDVAVTPVTGGGT